MTSVIEDLACSSLESYTFSVLKSPLNLFFPLNYKVFLFSWALLFGIIVYLNYSPPSILNSKGKFRSLPVTILVGLVLYSVFTMFLAAVMYTTACQWKLDKASRWFFGVKPAVTARLRPAIDRVLAANKNPPTEWTSEAEA